ncbi:MAG: hypothetical protein U9O24_02270 [Campylobacterota bacterium]|nr:hypothetical protein [Campylobacterota bacterium]
MQGSQYSVKVYETEIEDEIEFMAFFDANYTLFQNHLIVIQGELSEEIKSYLKEKSLNFIDNITLPKGRVKNSIRKSLEADLESEKIQNLAMQKIAEEKLTELSNKLENNLKVIDSRIRSGRELNIDGDLLLLNRVNSGATIKTSGNLIVTQVVEGSIRCNGNFLMLMASSKANIVFQGIEVDNALLSDTLNRVELENSKIKITPVLKKEINWA